MQTDILKPLLFLLIPTDFRKDNITKIGGEFLKLWEGVALRFGTYLSILRISVDKNKDSNGLIFLFEYKLQCKCACIS